MWFHNTYESLRCARNLAQGFSTWLPTACTGAALTMTEARIPLRDADVIGVGCGPASGIQRAPQVLLVCGQGWGPLP